VQEDQVKEEEKKRWEWDGSPEASLHRVTSLAATEDPRRKKKSADFPPPIASLHHRTRVYRSMNQ
jgi:hypothetical protein